MPTPRSVRFQFDLDLIAPTQPDRAAREREWARLVAHFVPRLRDYFKGQVEDGDALDELLSFTITRAIRSLHEIGHPDAAWNWLRTTGANRIREVRRNTRRAEDRAERYAAEQNHFEVTRVDQWEDEDEDKDLSLGSRIPVDRATWDGRLGALSANDLKLFHLVSVEGKTHHDAAIELGISAAACRKRYSRIAGFLRTGQRQA